MTARTTLPTRRGMRAAALGGLVAACLAFGVSACSSDTERLADRSDSSAAAAVQTLDAPLNALPTSGQDPADPTVSPEPVVTGTPTESNITTLVDVPDQAPVSTVGPIAPAGNIDEIVPEAQVTTAPAVALSDTANFGSQVSARISQVSAVQANATLPGEISGPAIAVTVEIANSSGDTIGVDTVTVTMTDAAGNPASPISGDSAGPLHGTVAPGGATSGTYRFTVPADQRNPVTVTVNYSTGAPTLVFTGQVAGG